MDIRDGHHPKISYQCLSWVKKGQMPNSGRMAGVAVDAGTAPQCMRMIPSTALHSVGPIMLMGRAHGM
ncbi:hypothetical protein SAMN05519103_08711 [Rhizobiales bacterium GAS113]|nr:hypothetical protein SAMN05519103_08711 [Rhizobiales bacterium GAS113]